MSVLVLLLFNLCINDLPLCVNSAEYEWPYLLMIQHQSWYQQRQCITQLTACFVGMWWWLLLTSANFTAWRDASHSHSREILDDERNRLDCWTVESDEWVAGVSIIFALFGVFYEAWSWSEPIIEPQQVCTLVGMLCYCCRSSFFCLGLIALVCIWLAWCFSASNLFQEAWCCISILKLSNMYCNTSAQWWLNSHP